MDQAADSLFPLTNGTPGIGTYTPHTLTPITFTLIAQLDLVLFKTWSLNVQMDDNQQTFTSNSNENFSFSLNLSCSYDSSTPITYSLSQNGNEVIPDWITFNSGGSSISGTAPSLQENKSYSFFIDAQWNDKLDGNVPKLITLDIIVKEEPVETEITAAIVASQATFGAASAMVMVSSVASGSPSPGLWSMIQQQQMIIMLMLIDPFIPKRVMTYLKGIGIVFMSKLTSNTQ